MKLSLSKSAILVVLFLTTTAFAQQQGMSFNFFGGGARSEGMGQAFLAVSDDGTAGSWNPAGLYIHEKTLMSFGYSYLLPRGELSYYDDASLLNTYDHEGEFGGINNWHFVSPLRMKGHHFVLDIGYTRNFDTYSKFAENLMAERFGNNADPNAFYDRNGSINSVQVGFGTRIYKQLSFGMAGNIYYGKISTEEKRYFRDSTMFESEIPLIYESDIRVYDSSSYGGFNLTMGLLYTGEKVRAGLVMKTPFSMNGETDSTLVWLSTKNGVPYVDGAADYYVVGVDTFYLEMFNNDTAYVDDMTSKLEMPFIIGAGLAYNVNDNWLLSGDVEYRAFSNKEVKLLDSLFLSADGDRTEFFTPFDPNWSDVWQFRLGSEYVFNTSFARIPVRVGYRNEEFPEGNIRDVSVIYEGQKGPSADNDSTRIFYRFDYDQNKVVGYSLAFGFGMHFTQIMLDFAYTYSSYEQEIYTDQDVLLGKNEWKDHHINLSFTGYF